MKNFRIIARLEVKSDYVIKGIRMEGLKKIAPPVDIVKSFKNGYVDEIFYDDVVATLYNRPVNFKLIKSISELINIPFSVSGRIRSVSDIYKLFNIGADKVSINTSVFKNPQILNQASKIFGSQSICSHIQYKNLFRYEKNPEVFSESGRERQNIKLFDWIKIVQDYGAGEIYLFSIDNDGIDYDIDFEVLHKSRNISKVPLIYGGGINCFQKIKNLIDVGFDGVTISSALYDGSINILEIKKKLSRIYKNINFHV
jgi:cyclase